MTTPASYQLIFLGKQDDRRRKIVNAINRGAIDLGLKGGEIEFLDEISASSRDRRMPATAIFLGSSPIISSTVLADLIQDSLVVIPVVSATHNVSNELPSDLHHVNALVFNAATDSASRIASLVFEIFRLLRSERKLFISYRRKDSQPLANRLYDELDQRGFDTFLDIRSVPPAAAFQDQLWHQMSDADVVVLIDTPGFRKSRWTQAELARANATNIQILHLLWPGQNEDSESAMSNFFVLENSDFQRGSPGRGASITPDAINRICNLAEELRSRALAARYRYLLDQFCDAARDIGFIPSVQTERWISIAKPDGDIVAIIPAVGVPTAERINDIFIAISTLPKPPSSYWMIYDNRGILAKWLGHLDWLDQHLPVRAVKMSGVSRALRGMIP